jgi:hypothetical protein
MRTKEKTSYEIQAEEFLTKTNTILKVKFLKNDFHFDNDKEKRDIYEITLIRGERKFKFKFGQSLNDSGIKIVNRNTRKVFKKFSRSEYIDDNGNFKESTFRYRCGWQFSSIDEIVLPVAPDAYSILACLEKYGYEDFMDFCIQFDYDSDSRKAEKIYNAVQKEYDNLCMLYSHEEVEMLREIQ